MSDPVAVPADGSADPAPLEPVPATEDIPSPSSTEPQTDETVPAEEDIPPADAAADAVATSTPDVVPGSSATGTAVSSTAPAAEEKVASEDDPADGPENGPPEDIPNGPGSDEAPSDADQQSPPPPPPLPEAEPAPAAPDPELISALKEEWTRELRASWDAELAARPKEVEIVRETVREIRNFQSDHGFEDGECTLIGPEELYCSRKTSASPTRPLRAGGAFAAQDAEGDREIYLREDGRDLQITNNRAEDAAPVWDKQAGLLIWQSLVGERWIIRGYDRLRGTEFEVPGQGSNNLNPQVFRNRVVWQAWIGPNWEIMAATRDENGVWIAERITDNGWPDVSPHISNGLLLWQSYEDGTWQVLSHDLSSRTTVRLSRGTGRNEHPRLAVLWDSTEGGATRTMQYNLATGELTMLPESAPAADVGPAPVPENPMPVTPMPTPGSTPTPLPPPPAKNPDGLSDHETE